MMIHNRILKPPTAVLGVLILLSPPIQAGDCMRLCNPEFLKIVSASAPDRIDKGSDINGRDNNLNTPLHFTSFWSNTQAMRLAGGRGRSEHQYRKRANPASSGG